MSGAFQGSNALGRPEWAALQPGCPHRNPRDVRWRETGEIVSARVEIPVDGVSALADNIILRRTSSRRDRPAAIDGTVAGCGIVG